MANNKPKMLICFSGGRTSAYMTDVLLQEYSKNYQFLVCFANTGWEHEKTLEFVHNCDKRWGGKVVWLEAVIHHKKGVAPTHKIVTFETASRNQYPFEQMVMKQGIPNKGYPHCTRDLKEYPIQSYVKSKGWTLGRIENGQVVLPDYMTAIGVREDEPKRIKRNITTQNKCYPLVDMFPTDKVDVLNFWEDQDFDLEIPEHLGNCLGCFKKSEKKLMQVMRDMPDAFKFSEHIEREYGHIGPNRIHGVYVDEPRTMYRNFMTTPDLIQMFKGSEFSKVNDTDLSTCGEDCSAFSDDSYFMDSDACSYEAYVTKIKESSIDHTAKGAYITHKIRTSASEQKITDAINMLKQRGEKTSKVAVAKICGISREQITRRYSHLFEVTNAAS